MRKIRIDARGVEKEVRKRTRARKIPEGEYVAKVQAVTLETSVKDDTSRYLRWACVVTEGKHKGATVYGNTSLKKEALWNLRNLIFAATGKNIAGRITEMDPERLLGKVVGISVSDNEYTRDGRTTVTSQIDSYFPRDEVNAADEDDEDEEEEEDEDEEEEDEEEEEEAPRRKRSSKRRRAEEDEDEDEDLEEVDVDEL